MRSYRVLITPTADQDLNAAVDYYNLIADGLGDRFIDLVSDYMHQISTLPTASAIRYLNVRCKPMKTFPYLIMFTINEDSNSVAVLRFFHTSQTTFW